MNALSTIQRLVKPSFYKTLPNRLIRRSPWYHNLFEDAFRIQCIPQHLDIINLGSNPAKFGFDYSGTGISGFNLAVGPQTLSYDYRILRNFHSYLDDKGSRIILLGLFPLTMCKDRYTEHDGDLYKNLRYYPFMHRALIENFDESLYEKYVKHPERLGLKVWIKALLFHKKSNLNIQYSTLTNEQMNESAKTMINGWLREFYMNEFDATNLSKQVRESLVKNSQVLDDIIRFCEDRSITPVVVLLPISKYLSQYFNEEFMEKCLYSILWSKKITVLDYSKDTRFTGSESFLDALRLNLSGRQLFSSQVIKDLKDLNLLK